MINILKNPAYAGAYVYGRRRPDPLRRQPGSDRIGTAAVAPEDWSICLKDAHPAYLDWDEFMANRRQLADNVGRYDAGRPGAPRKGNALLQGIVSCGRCARRMCLRYSGPHGDYPVYVCVADSSAEGRPRCQEVRALAVDAEVERLILTALTPDRIVLAIAALGEIEEETRTMERQWSLKRERARYDAERARRQYDAVEPENRLVARSLERVWEERLRRVDRVEQEYDAWRREQSVSISDNDRAEILALGEELPRLWRAATTRSTDRKQIVRLVIKDVALDQKRRRGYAGSRSFGKLAPQASTGCNGACKATNNTPIRTVSGNVSPSLQAAEDGWRGRSDSQQGGAPHSAWSAVLRRHGSCFAEEVADPERQDQRYSREPAAVARRKLLGPGRRRGHRHHTSGHIRLAPKGWLTGTQLAKGMPWQISLSPNQAAVLRAEFDAPTGPRERHHESVELPNMSPRSPKPRFEVRIIAPC